MKSSFTHASDIKPDARSFPCYVQGAYSGNIYLATSCESAIIVVLGDNPGPYDYIMRVLESNYANISVYPLAKGHIDIDLP